MAKREIYLITQGDDLGGSYSANRAIFEAWKYGELRNASFMVNGIAARDAAKLLAREDGCCIGLHCTLHAEWDRVRWGPVLPPKQVPSLVLEDGTLHRSPQDWLTSGVNVQEVMAEVQAQLEAARSLGFKPFYADTHMGFERIDERLPSLFDEWCQNEQLMSYRNVATDIRYTGPGMEDEPVLGVIQALESVDPGIYRLITHPTFEDDEIRAFGNAHISGEQIAKERDADRRLFQDERLKRYFAQNGIHTIRYDELWKYR